MWFSNSKIPLNTTHLIWLLKTKFKELSPIRFVPFDIPYKQDEGSENQIQENEQTSTKSELNKDDAEVITDD